MTDDDPFADLGETLDEDPEEQREGEDDGGATTDGSSTGGSDQDDRTDAYDPTTDPAFTYEAAHQRPFYAREVTIDEFDAWLNYELERELSERGYGNVVVREMTDALLRTVVEEDLVDAVAERFEAARDRAGTESNE